ncbi:hypothetical protein MKW98_012193, partial [Papaver atlanticum]
MGSSSNAPSQQIPSIGIGHLLPTWDFQIPILGTLDVVSIEGGSFDRENIV